VGVAVLDSGVTSWHDDLTGAGISTTQRVDQFVDFVNGQLMPYDDFGHGTHVAGIIAGNGFDSGGARSGIAPAARLVVLKVLDGAGQGRISDVIAAIDYVINVKDVLGIRIINLSVGAGVYESYDTDLLTLAAKRAVEEGIVVVAAAGNLGRSVDGSLQYGGITAPGNAPWVLTVGASNHTGTSPDVVAGFSSRGPTAIDGIAKPDVVAPGVRIASLSDPNSAFYTSHSSYLLSGTMPTPYFPYLSLSGTSQAAPIVAGTVALMLQANPTLTPNAVKAILQYTAQPDNAGDDPLTQGAGLLNAGGAIDLARAFAVPPVTWAPPQGWGLRLTWGNGLFQGGQLLATANAWRTDVVWGSTTTPGGQPVRWGRLCGTPNCTITLPWNAWTPSSPHIQIWAGNRSFGGGGGPFGVESTSFDDDDTVVWGNTCDPDDPRCW
jgi:serine protease AprX